MKILMLEELYLKGVIGLVSVEKGRDMVLFL